MRQALNGTDDLSAGSTLDCGLRKIEVGEAFSSDAYYSGANHDRAEHSGFIKDRLLQSLILEFAI